MRRSTEEGFALISALWLLLLGASIAALLMLRSITTARDLHGQRDMLDNDLGVEEVVETIAAELLSRGQASHWAQLPASGSIVTGAGAITAVATAEEDIADVNKADLNLLAEALQAEGYVPAERTPLLDRIAANRAAGHMVASYAEVAALGTGILPAGREDCLTKVLSPFGGTVRPATGMPVGGGVMHVGSVLRITIGHRILVMRLTAANDRPYGLLDDYVGSCPEGATA